MSKQSLELLSPARTADIGIQAINHGADAIYIGPDGFGARKSASNSLDDIKRLVEYSHTYRCRVYATVNTIIYPNELKKAEQLCKDLYRSGVDALIVQDMGILRLDLPPIELHASTQCDIRTVEKAKFLQEVGFSQLVLARELTLTQIKEIAASVSIPIETFIHGALCVSYSGKCSASQLCLGRSANRGECAQMCRLPYTLTDANGKIIAKNKHLLSLHDLNLADRIDKLIEAGVSSFKIEGRLKDNIYVNNIVAYYRQLLDRYILEAGGDYMRSSYGNSIPGFEPNPVKSFNRGFTHYFIDNPKPKHIASIYTPKSLGEPVKVEDLHPGDGIAYIDKEGKYTGIRVNNVINGIIKTFGNVRIPSHVALRRTFDRIHTDSVSSSNPARKIKVDILLSDGNATISDERGLSMTLKLPHSTVGKKNHLKIKEIFGKLGATPYVLDTFMDNLPDTFTLPPSQLTQFRRELIEKLNVLNNITYPYRYRRAENKSYPYPSNQLMSNDNVANPLAETFYREHGVTKIDKALEVSSLKREKYIAMTCRHCILRELNMCLKDSKNNKIQLPLKLKSGSFSFTPEFNCDKCEMKLLSEK